MKTTLGREWGQPYFRHNPNPDAIEATPMTTPSRLTAADLRALKACKEQTEQFAAAYPDGATVDDVPALMAAGLDVEWLAKQVLPRDDWQAYEAACDAQWQAYEAACAPHWQAYEAACAAHWQAYEAACAPHQQAYLAARAPHWQAYEAACAPHRQAYEAARAPHRQAYEAACAPHWQAYEAACAALLADALRSIIPPTQRSPEP